MRSVLPVLCLLLLAGATLGARVPQDLLGADGHGLGLAVQDGNTAEDELGAMMAQLPAMEDEDDDAWEVIDENDPYDDLQSAQRAMALAAAAGDHPPGTTGLEGSGLHDYDNETFCHDRAYRKRTMKILYDRAFMGLFYDLKHQTRFEGSGVAFVKGKYYVIFDSLRTIGRIDQRLSYRGPDNFLIGDGLLEDSQFEGISYSEKTDSFIIVRESWSPSNDSDLLVPLTEEVHIKHDESQFTPLRRCPVDFQLEDVNKGFESIYYFEHGGERYLLGLCESNSCLTVAAGPDSPGLQRGNGRLILTKYRQGRTLDHNGPRVPGEPVGTVHSDNKTKCVWEYVKTIEIPQSAYMLDYAGIAFRKPFGKRVAIVSQEDASVWLGKFNWTTMEFVEDKGKLFHLPRDNHCNKIFCNVEGIQFIDDMRVVLTSDKHKASVQSYHCADHDQSIHVFGFP